MLILLADSCPSLKTLPKHLFLQAENLSLCCSLYVATLRESLLCETLTQKNATLMGLCTGALGSTELQGRSREGSGGDLGHIAHSPPLCLWATGPLGRERDPAAALGSGLCRIAARRGGSKSLLILEERGTMGQSPPRTSGPVLLAPLIASKSGVGPLMGHQSGPPWSWGGASLQGEGT